MDRNTLIALAGTAALYFAWQWSIDVRFPHAHDKVPAAVATTSRPAEAPQATEPAARLPGTEPAAAPGETASPAPVPAVPEQRITIERALYRATFSTRGGVLTDWTLKTYDDKSLEGHPAVTLTPGGETAFLATPFAELGHGDLSALAYTVARPNPDTLVFEGQAGGTRIRKTYTFEGEGYGARLSIELANQGAAAISPTYGVQWPARRGPGAEYGYFHLSAYRSEKLLDFAVSPLPSPLGIGGGPAKAVLEVVPKAGDPFELDWAGAHTRYFIAALLPDKPQDARAVMTPVEPGEEGRLDVSFAPVSLPPGSTLARDYRLYLGPKEEARLEKFGAHLDEAIQKGWAPSLARLFTWMLTAVHEVVPNYGLAILLLTIVIRVALAPLMVGQMRSMRRMSEVMPRIKAAQDAAKARYPDDAAKQQEATMAAYQQAGISPLSTFGGCLPMLLQMPVFVGFYSALQGSIQLRQQPFFGWISDLSQPESLFTIPGLDLHVRALPLLLGAAMVFQQRLTPAPNMDPAQARTMQIVMPVMMTLMFYQFASGLGLYWLMSTLIGVGQQVFMNRGKAAPATA